MRQMKMTILLVILITGCAKERLVAEDTSAIHREIISKSPVSSEFFEKSILKSIVANDSFLRINEWYTSDSILYSTIEKGISSIRSFHIFSGEDQLFYETHYPIVNLKANKDYSLFAVHEMMSSHKSMLTILNRQGEIIYRKSFLTTELNLFWNPYNEEMLLTTNMLPNWEFNVLILDTFKEKVEEIDVHNPFVHWYSKNSIAYLNWDEGSGQEAPLYVYNLKSKERKRVLEQKVVSFFTFSNMLLTVTEEKNNLSNAKFSFYQLSPTQKLSEFFVPVLNTYSEHWWLPEHDIDLDRKRFYYIKPKLDSSMQSIEGYQFVEFNIENGKSHSIVQENTNSQIRCSPDGKRCLIGKQFEKLVNVSDQKIVPLVDLSL